MATKALDATEAPQWFTLRCTDDIRIKVKALSAPERQALVASVERAPVLGFALMEQRQGIGADEPTEQAKYAAQVAWAEGLSERQRAALLSAEGYQIRQLRAWVAACVVECLIDGEPYAPGLLPLLDAIHDPGLKVEALLEAAGLCAEFSTLGKAGPMCSARLCGAPTREPVDGPASDALPASESSEGTAASRSPTAPDSPREDQPAKSSATGGRC